MIIDGQQRLVTTTILIAAIRDYFHGQGQDRALDIQREYLSKRDIRTQEDTPHLHLIPEDREFLVKRILSAPGSDGREMVPTTPAQQRILRASELAESFVANIVSTTHEQDDLLLNLLEFLNDSAKLISVTVGSEANAYVIFEVLNDRGLDLSVSDLLKNFLYRQAGSRLPEVQSSWASMRNTVSELAGEPDIKNFIRQAWISRHGLTREKNLYDAIKKQVTTSSKAVEFGKELAAAAIIYSALDNPAHATWKPYGDSVVESIEVLNELGVSQIRPLLLAIIRKFKAEEVKLALPMVVAWSVRFLICGSGGSGTLESHYAERAKEVSSGQITTAKKLFETMKEVLPDDKRFEETFAQATVSKSNLAKYYLRVLERQQNSSNEDEVIVNPDDEKVNLEHIMPQTRGAGWTHVLEDDHRALLKRIGNLTIMRKRLNSKAANAPFADKQKLFALSKITLTSELTNYAQWSGAEIEDRQKVLAKLAVTAWPIKPRPTS